MKEIKSNLSEHDYQYGTFKNDFANLILEYLNNLKKYSEILNECTNLDYYSIPAKETLLDNPDKKFKVVNNYYVRDLSFHENYYVENWDFDIMQGFKNGSTKTKTIFTIELTINKEPIFKDNNFVGNIYSFYLEDEIYNKINKYVNIEKFLNN